MPKVVLELTESEIKELHPEITEIIKKLDWDVVAHLLAGYILHKNGSEYKKVLNDLIKLNNTIIKGRVK